MSDVTNPNSDPNSVQAQRSAISQADARGKLRQHLLSTRRHLSDTQILEYSSAICNSLLPMIESVENLAGYIALGNEVRVDSVLSIARQRLCKTYVPIVQSDHQMVFAQIDHDTALVTNKFGILEPDLEKTESISPNSLDAVLVPLVGFDEQCQRMGMGGGFYDRAFSENKDSPVGLKKPLLIGVAYDIQQTASVLQDWWDVPLDIIVTETRILRRHR
ncbi:MAG: 5-formyltetrahydrofolate cyclo-ligase [Patiriisocius sp.]|jgi:5-formyltetrahydrofolate cyclo-ligase